MEKFPFAILLYPAKRSMETRWIHTHTHTESACACVFCTSIDWICMSNLIAASIVIKSKYTTQKKSQGKRDSGTRWILIILHNAHLLWTRAFFLFFFFLACFVDWIYYLAGPAFYYLKSTIKFYAMATDISNATCTSSSPSPPTTTTTTIANDSSLSADISVRFFGLPCIRDTLALTSFFFVWIDYWIETSSARRETTTTKVITQDTILETTMQLIQCACRLIQDHRDVLLRELFSLTREKKDAIVFLKSSETLSTVDLAREQEFLRIHALA